MARQPRKPPAARLNTSGGTRPLIGGPRFLTAVQRDEFRRKLAEVEAKLRQKGAVERERR
jgi:hypothetical protein